MNRSEKFFDRVASKSAKPAIKANTTSFKTIESTKKYLNGEDTVLDFGCGTGVITSEIAHHVKAIHAIDISSGMISVAKKNATERQVENIHFAKSTIFDERLKQESFNVIMAFNILHYLDNKQMVMLRINKLLKPGGLFISATACLAEKRTFLHRLVYFLSKLGIIPTMNRYKISELENLITSGGFKIIKKESLSRLPERFIVARKIKYDA